MILTGLHWPDIPRLVQAGTDLYVVKELLGHKSITMTMRYAHHNSESLRSGVDILDKCYNPAKMDKKEGPTEDRKSLILNGSGDRI